MSAAAYRIALVAAFGAGGLLTLMILFNGTLATTDGALFASWAAHGTGTIAASLMLLVRPRASGSTSGRLSGGAPAIGRAPLWAYLGGVSGAVTVILTSVTLNTALALSGTLALGLLGQVAFGLAADRWGLFGLPRRRPTVRDIAALALILAGSALIIFADRLPPLAGLAGVAGGGA